MNTANILLIIGLAVVILYLLMGIDDFVWDIFGLFRRGSYRKQLLDLHKLDSTPPKLLALAIAAWHESNVLGDVIDNVQASVLYPKSMYHIFLGVYPNDPETIAVAQALSERYSNVHVVINERPGPTSKAQNINYVYRQIKAYESSRGLRFASLTIHDSEDVVHPYELKVTNYLLETHEAIQFPVFPLMPLPRFSNFFHNITAGTYADEFAENHFTTMVGRYSSGAFVPSAGTGFALSRSALDRFGEADILPQDSLTEDYRMSLTLYEAGVPLYYVLERIPRVNANNELSWDFIATRSMFPNTFKTAVKQKARWILGITMQSFRFREIFQSSSLRLAARYTLYKDSKAKIANLLAMIGYPLLIYFLVSLFVPVLPIYPAGSVSWYLSIVVTCMMVERQIFRCVAIYRVYGMRSVFFGCLLPPLMPIRLVWGNIINLAATLRAYRQNFTAGKNTAKKPTRAELKAGVPKTAVPKKKLAWSKTDHQFLEKQVLRRYQRNLGDILLEKGYVSIHELSAALQRTAGNGQKLGAYLMKRGLLSEEQLLNALSTVKHIQFIDIGDLGDYALSQFASVFDEALLRSLLCVPLLQTSDGTVIAFCDESPIDAQTTLRNTYSIEIHAVFASRGTVVAAIANVFSGESPSISEQSPAQTLFERGDIDYEQLILARAFRHKTNVSEREILEKMGLMA